MKKQDWNWGFDQWFEDKLWSKFPEKYASPHMFFLLGIWTALVLFIVIGAFLNTL